MNLFFFYFYCLNKYCTCSLILNCCFVFQDLNFSFEVYPVKDCPMDKEAWELASARLQCNKTHGYHCVPNKQLTSLIEFCYPKGYKYPFESGICKLYWFSLYNAFFHIRKRLLNLHSFATSYICKYLWGNPDELFSFAGYFLNTTCRYLVLTFKIIFLFLLVY